MKQFEIVKRETNTSHVEKYGDMVSKLNNNYLRFSSVDGRQVDLIDVTTVFILMFSHP